MFGKKKQQAEETKREAEAPAPAEEAKEEKRGLFGRKKKRPEKAPQEAPAPQAAVPAPVQAEAPKESRRARKLREKEEAQKEERIRDLELQLHRSEKRRKNARFCDFFAFAVLIFAALLMVLGPLLKLILEQTGGVKAMETVSIIAQYCLLAAIAIPAWYFVYRKGIAWKIIFFVALAAFIVGNILGLTL